MLLWKHSLRSLQTGDLTLNKQLTVVVWLFACHFRTFHDFRYAQEIVSIKIVYLKPNMGNVAAEILLLLKKGRKVARSYGMNANLITGDARKVSMRS